MNKMKKQFDVTVTRICSTTVRVEAGNSDEALDLVQNDKEHYAPVSLFDNYETTVDDAELVE